MIHKLTNFKGEHYRLADNWFSIIDEKNYNDRPINYLEIGAFYGANLLSVETSFAIHEQSKLYAIDPWEHYGEYPEYNGEQETIYRMFLNNIENSGKKNKIEVRRGYSHNIIPTLPDNFFDIIYIDGNHEPSFVLEDAVLSFRKLKRGGILIFDDYGWGGPDLTQRGIDGFISGFHKKIVVLGMSDIQMFVKKIC